MSDVPLFGPDRSELVSNWFLGTQTEPNRTNAYLLVGEVISIALVIIGAIALLHGGIVIAAPLAHFFLAGGSIGAIAFGTLMISHLPKHAKNKINPIEYRKDELALADSQYIRDKEYTIYEDRHNCCAIANIRGRTQLFRQDAKELKELYFVSREDLRRRKSIDHKQDILSHDQIYQYLSFIQVGEYLTYYERGKECYYLARSSDGIIFKQGAVATADLSRYTYISIEELEKRKSKKEYPALFNKFASVEEAKKYQAALEEYEYVEIEGGESLSKNAWHFKHGQLFTDKIQVSVKELKERTLFQSDAEALWYADELSIDEYAQSKKGSYFTQDGRVDDKPIGKTFVFASNLKAREQFFDLPNDE